MVVQVGTHRFSDDDDIVLPVLNTNRGQTDVHLTLCLTHDCNLRCRYCYAGGKVPRSMPAEVATRAIDLALTRVSERLHLAFFGGEPTLRWDDLVGFANHARERADRAGIALKPTVTTNGTLLDQERTAWLATQGFLVAISCDGTQPAHDTNRRSASGTSTFEATREAIQRCLRAGLRVRVISVLDPSNVELWPESVATLVGLGACELVTNINWAADWSTEAVQAQCQSAYQKCGELYVAAYRQHKPFWLSLIDGKIASHIKGGYLPTDHCDLGQRNLVVAASGRLYPCDRLVGDDLDDTLAVGDVWAGPDPRRLQQLVSKVTAPPECANCALANRCRNRCACANLAMLGSIDVPSETLCFHEQLAIRTADRAAEILFGEGNPLFLTQHYYRPC
jgi:uncharacterized protein